MDFTKVSWKKLDKDTNALANKIGELKLDEIVCISRGGMVVARILSDLLDLKISHITIESYANLQQEKEPVVTQLSPRAFKGETVLLVDELADNGKTFLRAIDYLERLPIKKIYTAAPYIKPSTKYMPDFWVEKLDNWIIFPYEIRETKESFIKEFGEEEGIEKLRELGL